MKVWKNLFKKGDKVNASEIAVAPGLMLPGAVIVESGSNAGGNYIKWGDGTMVCYRANVTISYYNTTRLTSTWTYPAVFIGIPAVFVVFSDPSKIEGMAGGSKNAGALIAGISRTNNSDLRVYNAGAYFDEGDSAGVDVCAIGRWK